jgi:hypothetical protein
VLLFDYRGYGGNPGRPSEEGLARDVRAAHRFLIEEVDVVKLIEAVVELVERVCEAPRTGGARGTPRPSPPPA